MASTEDYRDAAEERQTTNDAESAIASIIVAAVVTGIAVGGTIGAAVTADRVASEIKAVGVRAVRNVLGILQRRSGRTIDITPAESRAEQVLDVTVQKVLDEIDKQIESSDPAPDIYDIEQPALSKADQVANTAVTIAVEDAKHQAALQLGLTHARWLTENDQRVRSSHEAMEGQVRPIGEKFVSGAGNELEHPGDVEAPPSEWMNCRCRLQYFREDTSS